MQLSPTAQEELYIFTLVSVNLKSLNPAGHSYFSPHDFVFQNQSESVLVTELMEPNMLLISKLASLKQVFFPPHSSLDNIT